MRFALALALYRLLLPLIFSVAFPGWLLKMKRRGGFGTGLGERVACYRRQIAAEPNAAVHLHAISVGEAMIALKLIRAWQHHAPAQRFVIATGTATGHAIATAAVLPNLRVIYAPLDFHWMIRRYLKRFKPAQIILIEGEVWPHLLLECQSQSIPIQLVNARLSPRSARRYQKFQHWLQPLFEMLDGVAIQEAEASQIWQNLGVSAAKIQLTGSIKFDPDHAALPQLRPEFQKILAACGPSRPVVLAASTFPGEERWIIEAIRSANPNALPVIVPRHAERRNTVATELAEMGFEVLLKSRFLPPTDPSRACLVIDTTGELCDWIAHADVVIIGKSFLAQGGQNLSEAIFGGKPIICGPNMQNFQPLTDQLSAAAAIIVARDSPALSAAIIAALVPATAQQLATRASKILDHHRSATQRTLEWIYNSPIPDKSRSSRAISR
jgi:3-deoxy-D-manno-octulosonic-acid transferase